MMRVGETDVSASFAEAFTVSVIAEQAAFLLLVLGVLSTRFSRARALIASGAFIGLCQALWSGAPLPAFWWGLLLVASLGVIARRLFEEKRTRFSEEEEKMLGGVLSPLPRSAARHLLDQGFWLSGREGDVLTREEEPVSHLFYLASGEARVLSEGRQVGVCRAGDLVGEVTVLSGEEASATVVLSSPARFWCAPATVLRPYLEAHADVRHALEQGFTASLRAKFRASNRRIAEAGGVAA
jgi:CRP-like cAMP-binding protein